MNFSSVRGYNAYAQFTAQIRDAREARDVAKLQESTVEPKVKQEQAGSGFSDPVDTVSISHSARSMSLSFIAERESATTTLREWIRESETSSGVFTHRVSGQMMADLLSSSGITFDEDESYSIEIDVWCAVTVAGKNAEKAKAIQDLLNSTPSGINWGFLLQKLPLSS